MRRGVRLFVAYSLIIFGLFMFLILPKPISPLSFIIMGVIIVMGVVCFFGNSEFCVSLFGTIAFVTSLMFFWQEFSENHKQIIQSFLSIIFIGLPGISYAYKTRFGFIKKLNIQSSNSILASDEAADSLYQQHSTTVSTEENVAQQIIHPDVLEAARTDVFNPGDRVVSLASAARSAAIVAGGVSGAIAAWIVQYELVFSGIIGVIVGWILGTLAGRIMFSAPKGKTVIVKVGTSSLMILKGNVIASLITGITVCQLISFLTKTNFTEIALASVGSSLIVGIIFAFLASLG